MLAKIPNSTVVTPKLAAFVVAAKFGSFPADIAAKTKPLNLDMQGYAIGGRAHR